MRVLIADQFEQSGRDELARLGCEVRFAPKLKDEALAAEVEQFRPDVLVVRSTKVPEAVLAAGALKLVVRAGAGYNTIDVAAASRRGIYVSNCPGKNSVAVAELAFGLLLALDRQIPDNVLALRQGQWNKSGFSKARGLYGRTLGLIGLGQIGREVVLRAKVFGLPVVAWSRSLTEDVASRLNAQGGARVLGPAGGRAAGIPDAFRKDFLLPDDSSRRLFSAVADQPILDFHCHLPPADVARDAPLRTIAHAWLGGDHYKWRAMRANGVPEATSPATSRTTAPSWPGPGPCRACWATRSTTGPTWNCSATSGSTTRCPSGPRR